MERFIFALAVGLFALAFPVLMLVAVLVTLLHVPAVYVAAIVTSLLGALVKIALAWLKTPHDAPKEHS